LCVWRKNNRYCSGNKWSTITRFTILLVSVRCFDYVINSKLLLVGADDKDDEGREDEEEEKENGGDEIDDEEEENGIAPGIRNLKCCCVDQ
jgi:hypothetical protein